MGNQARLLLKLLPLLWLSSLLVEGQLMNGIRGTQKSSNDVQSTLSRVVDAVGDSAPERLEEGVPVHGIVSGTDGSNPRYALPILNTVRDARGLGLYAYLHPMYTESGRRSIPDWDTIRLLVSREEVPSRESYDYALTVDTVLGSEGDPRGFIRFELHACDDIWDEIPVDSLFYTRWDISGLQGDLALRTSVVFSNADGLVPLEMKSAGMEVPHTTPVACGGSLNMYILKNTVSSVTWDVDIVVSPSSLEAGGKRPAIPSRLLLANDTAVHCPAGEAREDWARVIPLTGIGGSSKTEVSFRVEPSMREVFLGFESDEEPSHAAAGGDCRQLPMFEWYSIHKVAPDESRELWRTIVDIGAVVVLFGTCIGFCWVSDASKDSSRGRGYLALEEDETRPGQHTISGAVHEALLASRAGSQFGLGESLYEPPIEQEVNETTWMLAPESANDGSPSAMVRSGSGYQRRDDGLAGGTGTGTGAGAGGPPGYGDPDSWVSVQDPSDSYRSGYASNSLYLSSRLGDFETSQPQYGTGMDGGEKPELRDASNNSLPDYSAAVAASWTSQHSVLSVPLPIDTRDTPMGTPAASAPGSPRLAGALSTDPSTRAHDVVIRAATTDTTTTTTRDEDEVGGLQGDDVFPQN